MISICPFNRSLIRENSFRLNNLNDDIYVDLTSNFDYQNLSFDDFSLRSSFFYMILYTIREVIDDFFISKFFSVFFFNNTRHNTRRSVNVSFEAKSQQNCYCVWQVFNGLAVSQHTTGIYKVRTTTSSLGFPLSDEKSYATSLSTGTPSPLRLDTYAARKKINRDE